MKTNRIFKNEMKALIAFLFAVVMTLNFSACTEYDNPVSNPTADVLTGMWYAETEAQGSIGQGENAQEYYKVVQVCTFDNATEGLWTKYYINRADEVITQEGGFYFGNFTYTSTSDGKITVNVINDNNNVEEADHWTMYYGFGVISGTDGNEDYKLAPATDDQKEMIQAWGRQVGFGADPKDLGYNINNDARVDTPFDRTNWRTSNAIYLYNGIGDFKDGEQRGGYEMVLLPWADISANGASARKSNLPAEFCDDITPENGWELVANFCGDRLNKNTNFFALYNKYLGKLRYFYYIPGEIKLNNAADHNFEIMMQNGTAEHSVFRYAVPMDRKLSNPEAIKAKHDGYWSQFVTPWGATFDQLGQMAPAEGWFAFDVDLSVYRGAGNSMKADQVIKPFLRGYSNSNIDLFGKLNADIAGNIDMKKCCVNTSNGVFGPLEDVLGQVKDIKDFIGGAADVYKNLMSGDILGAIEGGIGIAKQGCDLVGIDYGKTSEGFDGYKGDVNLKMSGTIDMTGKLVSSNVIQGFASPQQSIEAFNFDETTLGEGVWNIETAPVVYYTNAQLQWREEYTKSWDLFHGWNEFEVTLTGKDSPFGAKKQALVVNGKKEYNTSKDPWCGYVNYFDPSSVKVVLNPNLFTADEIKNAQVYATCGVRKGNSAFGSLDSYRAAQNLSGSKLSIDKKNGGEYYNRPFTEAPFDALSSSQDKHDMKPVLSSMLQSTMVTTAVCSDAAILSTSSSHSLCRATITHCAPTCPLTR